jgi:hypothetical protein
VSLSWRAACSCCSPPPAPGPSTSSEPWLVDDLAAEVAQLRSRGVVFEEYDQSGLRTVDGIAATPVGNAAWLKDSEGNVLSVTQLG